MLNLVNRAKWQAVVSEAIQNALANCQDDRTAERWVNAIERAAAMVETQPEFISWLPEENAVVIFNTETGGVYEANGVCQCKAFEKGFPCKHRAMARLVQRYFDDPAEEAGSLSADECMFKIHRWFAQFKVWGIVPMDAEDLDAVSDDIADAVFQFATTPPATTEPRLMIAQ